MIFLHTAIIANLIASILEESFAAQGSSAVLANLNFGDAAQCAPENDRDPVVNFGGQRLDDAGLDSRFFHGGPVLDTRGVVSWRLADGDSERNIEVSYTRRIPQSAHGIGTEEGGELAVTKDKIIEAMARALCARYTGSNPDAVDETEGYFITGEHWVVEGKSSWTAFSDDATICFDAINEAGFVIAPKGGGDPDYMPLCGGLVPGAN
jgi:hypothetical protein